MTAPYRTVYCLLGLPFDALTLDAALARLLVPISQCVPSGTAGGAGVQRRDQPDASDEQRGALVLSTPNVNWVVLAREHPAFRESVLASALTVADGQPLVWIARLLGVPLPERVSGADLFLGLRGAAHPVRVFFLGGMGHVARRASAALNQARETAGDGALIGVGGLDPGSGSIASMSRPEILHTVNEGQPDLVVVSLGALRGQAWLMQNRKALTTARWVTHLGAVVNFAAGEVRRAPRWMQRSGTEWAWRIVQEPKLWQRYVGDGISLFGLLLARTLPLLFWRALYARQSLPAESAPLDDGGGLRMRGAWVTEDHARQFHDAVRQTLAGQSVDIAGQPFRLDVAEVSNLGAAVIGQWMVLRGSLALQRRKLVLVSPSLAVRRLLRAEVADYLLD